MRCPSCRYVCADVREACPRCGQELRARGGETQGGQASKGSFFEALKRFFGLDTETHRLTPVPTRADHASAAPHDTPAKQSSNRDAPRASTSAESKISVNLTQSEAEVDRRLDEALIRLTPIVPEPLVVDLPQDTAYQDTEQTVAHSDESDPVRVYIDRSALDRAWVAQLEREPDEIDELFTDSLRSILADEDDDQILLQGEQFQRIERSEEVELLFDLADEEIRDPNAMQRYSIQPVTSEKRSLEAAGLQEQLKRVETALEAPMPSLSQLQKEAHALPTHSETLPLSHRVVSPAPGWRRLLAGCIDLVTVTLVSLVTIYALSGLLRPELAPLMPHPAALSALQLCSLGVLFLPTLGTWLILYPLLTLILTHTTVGLAIMGLEVTSSTGSTLKAGAATVRALLTPLSVLLGGGLPVIFGAQALHDRLSASLVTKTLAIEESA